MSLKYEPSSEPQEFDFHYEKRDNLSDANIRDFVFQAILHPKP